jgi:hypothetical protein
MIPVYGKNKCIRTLSAREEEGKWFFSESSCCALANAWQNFREIWPEDKSPGPIIIDWSPIILINFPEIDSNTVIYLMGSENEHDSDLSNLITSNEIIKSMSRKFKKNKKLLKDNPCLLDPSKCGGGSYEKK